MKSEQGELKVPFGRRGEALVAAVDVLEKGLACKCVCPGCGAQLLTRQGRKRRHFAHHNATGSDRCVERSIHAAAIQLLLTARQLTIPAKVVMVRKFSKTGALIERSQELCLERMVRFDACSPEVTIADSELGAMRPDVVGYRDGRELLIEVCFTHAVDAEKLEKMARYGRPAIEIDVADLDFHKGFGELERRVIEGAVHKQWLFYPGAAEARRTLEEEVDAEVARLDKILERQRAELRRKAELKATELEKRRLKDSEAERARQATAEAKFQAYRDKAVEEKERAIRVRLSIEGAWPHYLQRTHPDNGAIDAPCRLWQAALFNKFVFIKLPAKNCFTIVEVITWADNWFGRTPGSSLDATKAIQAFLSNLSHLGFLSYGLSRSGNFTYTVEHNELTLPQRRLTPQKETSDRNSDFERRRLDPLEQSIVDESNDKVKWSEEWPEYETVRKGVAKWLSISKRDELTLLDTLYEHRGNLPSPLEFAMIMRDHIPLAYVMGFLRSYGFVN